MGGIPLCFPGNSESGDTAMTVPDPARSFLGLCGFGIRQLG